MSTYRFKSRETGDLVMLKQHGKILLEIMGKDPSGPGIIQPAEMSGAVKAILAAVAADEAHQKPKEDEDADDASPSSDTVSLRVRSIPLIEMLQRCEKARVDIVWGV